MLTVSDVIESEALTSELTATKKRQREELTAPAGFDPACVFLLSMNFENLFDENPTNPFVFTCRGCDGAVKRPDRKKHHGAHKRAHDRKERNVSKTGPKEQQTRAARERQAATIPTPDTSPRPAKAVREKKPRASVPIVATGSRADSVKVLEALWERLTGVVAGLERHDNMNAGYAGFKLSGRLIGYAWLTNKADLRVEAAIPLGTIVDDRIVACNRSPAMASRTRIDVSGLDLALSMLSAAADREAA